MNGFERFEKKEIGENGGGEEKAKRLEEIETLKRKGYPFFLADFVTEKIRAALDEGKITLDELGLKSEEELEELLRENKREQIFTDWERFKEGWGMNAGFRLAPKYPEEIERYIQDGLITWEELGTDKEGIKEVVRQHLRTILLNGADSLHDRPPGLGCSASRGLATSVQKDIIEGVGSGLITWKELGINAEELPGLVRENEILATQRFLTNLKQLSQADYKTDDWGRHLLESGYLERQCQQIVQQVEGGEFSWEELRTTKEEVDGMLRRVEEKFGKK